MIEKQRDPEPAKMKRIKRTVNGDVATVSYQGKTTKETDNRKG